MRKDIRFFQNSGVLQEIPDALTIETSKRLIAEAESRATEKDWKILAPLLVEELERKAETYDSSPDFTVMATNARKLIEWIKAGCDPFADLSTLEPTPPERPVAQPLPIPDFSEYLTEKGKAIAPQLKNRWKACKPSRLVPLLYALSNRHLLEGVALPHPPINRDSFSESLRLFFDAEFAPNTLSDALNKHNRPSEKQNEAIRKAEREIDNFLTKD